MNTPDLPPPVRKERGPLAWILTGAACLLLLVVLVFGATMAARGVHRHIRRQWEEQKMHRQHEIPAHRDGHLVH
jgi:hypothetical protein